MKIAFYGDAFLDTFTEVREIKVNPESGCPVYVLGESRSYPGGAANAAKMIENFAEKTLFAMTSVCKERLVYRGEQKARIDTVKNNPSFEKDRDDSVRRLCAYNDLDAIVVSDYSCGWVTANSLQAILDYADEKGIPVVIDAKRIHDNVCYEGNVTFKCNEAEALALGMEMDWRSVSGFGIKHGFHVVVTRQEKPPIVGCIELSPFKFPQRPFQPSGAGDTFAAFLALYLAKRLSIEQAATEAYLAASAAGFFPPFRMPVMLREIQALADPARLKLLSSRQELIEWLAHRATGTLCVTNGCFDFHAGHADNLQECRKRADHLLVLVNSDESVRQLKGSGRPIMPLAERMRILASLESVSAVASFDETTPATALRLCTEIRGRKIDVLAKGEDYCPHEMRSEFLGIAHEYISIPNRFRQCTSAIIKRQIEFPIG